MAKWNILVATVGVRHNQFGKLVGALYPQVKKYNGDVEVIVYRDNFDTSLGQVRQALLEYSDAEYINYVDDDDTIPDYYCDKIYPLLDGVDYIGFRLQLDINGMLQKPTYHSIKMRQWWEDEKGYYRHTSHLNPMLREVALKGRFDKSIPEDVDWAHQVAPHVRTEHYIPDIMYYYHYSSTQSLWNKKDKPRGRFPKPELPPHFRYHPWSTDR